MMPPSPKSPALLRRSVSYDDYESFPRSAHESAFANDKESWDSPPENRPKLRVACFAFFLLGLNNSAFGSILPLFQLHNRNAVFFGDFRVVALFLAPMVGLTASTLLSIWLHRRIGIQGVLTLGSFFLTVSYFSIALYPTYSLLLLAFGTSGFGFGLLNTSFSTWIGTFQDVLRSLSIIQTYYYIAGLASAIVIYCLSSLGSSWSSFYYLMGLFSLVLLGLVQYHFKDETAQSFAFRLGYSTNSDETKKMIHEVLRLNKARTLVLFLFTITGLQVAGSSWMPMFIYAHPVKSYSSGAVALVMEGAYWLGLAAGSLYLCHISDRVKSTFKVSAFSMCAAVFSCILISFSGHSKSSLIIIPIFFVGFFLSPLPALGITKASDIFPEYLHVIGVSTIISGAQIGLFTLPFFLGYLSSMLGSAVILPAFTFILFVLLACWCLFHV